MQQKRNLAIFAIMHQQITFDKNSGFWMDRRLEEQKSIICSTYVIKKSFETNKINKHTNNCTTEAFQMGEMA